MRGRDSAEVRELLRSREARGLRVPLFARMAFMVFGLVTVGILVVATAAPTGGPVLVGLVFGTLGLALALNVYLLVLLRRGRHVEGVGLAGAIFDALFVIALSSLAQMAGAADGLSPGYVFESEMPITVATIVAINGLALRPRYPIVVGCGAVCALLVPAVRMALDPTTVFSSHRALVYGGTAIDVAQVITTIVMVAGIALAVSFAAHGARQTVRHGIAQELDNARLQQQQLRIVMREKVKALTRLVAGVSHEINTPIGALRSSVDTQGRVLTRLADSVSAQDRAAQRLLGVGQQTLASMRSAGERLSALEASLRALSHLDEADLRRVDLHAELDNVATTARRQHGSTTHLERDYGPLPEVYVHASDLNQALLTIVTNAFEAAGRDGTVTLRTRSHDDRVRIEISDDGPGISADRLPALFDVSLGGKGGRVAAGMGLAMAQSIVQRHGGELAVQSQPGAGATFTIELPLQGLAAGTTPGVDHESA